MPAAFLALTAAALISPIRIPSVVSTYANVVAANKWALEKGPSGQLITHSFNYETGMSDGYRVSSFESGSSIYFSLSPSLKPGQHVSVGDTVGTVTSSRMQEQLIALNGQLAAAQSQLAVNSTGSKSAIVDASEQRVESAKRRRADYQATVTRTQALFDEHLIPQGELDRVQSAMHTLDDAISIAQADLEAARTGDKPEQLALVQAHIVALKDEIRAVSSRAATYTLCTPIDGTVAPDFSGLTLLTILSTARYVALVPIRADDFNRVAGTPNARVSISGFSRPVHGHIVALDHQVAVSAGQKVVMATALLDAPPDDLLPGSVVHCKIECRPLTVREQGASLFHTVAASFDAPGGF